MNVITPSRRASGLFMALAIVACAIVAGVTPRIARAAGTDEGRADDGQTVECMLPGQIHTVAGHATMGARRPVQTTPADCRQRGGEYTVNEQASQPMHVQHAPATARDDARIVNCLLPKQVRQLGEKARYTTARRPIRTTRSDCNDRDGDMISSAQARRAARTWQASQPKRAAPNNRP